MTDQDRLMSTLGDPAFAWLIDRLRKRYERGDVSATGTISLSNASDEQRDAMDRLLGRKPTGGTSLSVRLDRLEQLLQHAGLADSLYNAIVAVSGPVTNRRALQEAEDRQWRAVFEDARSQTKRGDAGRRWLERLESDGSLKRMCSRDAQTGRDLMELAVAIFNTLPAANEPLARLAATHTGDAHALDHGRPLATLILRAAMELTGEWLDDTTASRRSLWAAIGVICDEFSAPVLVLNLRTTGTGLVDRLLNESADIGEPLRVTTGQLMRHAPHVDDMGDRPIYICENPAVLAMAASRYGPNTHPLICTEGQPSTAAHLLLSKLADANALLRYHGDFDWPGIGIANLMDRRYLTDPWRMSESDYLAAVAEATEPLAGSEVQSTWDDRLTAAMHEQGRIVYEEQVAETLIQDVHLPHDGHTTDKTHPISVHQEF